MRKIQKRNLNIDNIFIIIFFVILFGLFLYHLRITIFKPIINKTVINTSNITSNNEQNNFTDNIKKIINTDIKDVILNKVADVIPDDIKNRIKCKPCEGNPFKLNNGEIDYSNSIPTDFEITQNLRDIKDDDFAMDTYIANPDKVYY
jgi:hypothetical protein